MPLAQDRCLCVRKVEYSETSQILTLFAREHGLVRVIAKGAHRKTKVGASKFDGGIDLLDLGDAVFIHAPEKDLPPLTEWKLAEGHLALRRSLRGLYLGQYAAELIVVLFEEHDAHQDLWDRTIQTVADLGSERLEEAFLAFEFDLLRESGYLPELSVCVSCGRRSLERDQTYFSSPLGGIICRNCEAAAPDRTELDPRLLRLVQAILKLPKVAGAPQRLPRLTRHQTDPLNRILAGHIQQTLGRRLRLPPYVVGDRLQPSRESFQSSTGFVR